MRVSEYVKNCVIKRKREECNDEAERSNPDKCSIAELGCFVVTLLALPRNDYPASLHIYPTKGWWVLAMTEHIMIAK